MDVDFFSDDGSVFRFSLWPKQYFREPQEMVENRAIFINLARLHNRHTCSNLLFAYPIGSSGSLVPKTALGAF
jgi:hypothetical protein